MVWAYAVLQLYSDELFEFLAHRGVHHADCEPQHLANIAWACAEVSYTWSPLVDMASAAMAKLEEFGSKELGNILWSLSRLGGPRAAWPLFTAADRKRLDVGKSGVSAMLSNSERHKIPSRRSLADELRLLMRSRGDVRPFFVAAAAARAAEAGDVRKALHLLDSIEGQDIPLADQLRRACSSTPIGKTSSTIGFKAGFPSVEMAEDEVSPPSAFGQKTR